MVNFALYYAIEPMQHMLARTGTTKTHAYITECALCFQQGTIRLAKMATWKERGCVIVMAWVKEEGGFCLLYDPMMTGGKRGLFDNIVFFASRILSFTFIYVSHLSLCIVSIGCDS